MLFCGVISLALIRSIAIMGPLRASSIKDDLHSHFSSAPSSSHLKRLHLVQCDWTELIPFIAQSVIYLHVSIPTWTIPSAMIQTRLKYVHLIIGKVDESIIFKTEYIAQNLPGSALTVHRNST
jgi:hypothetical protein